MVEILKHWSIVGKQMGKGGNRNVLERKNRKNAHLLGLEMWCRPEAGRTFRARREETENPAKGAGAMDTHALAFLLSTGRSESGLERGPNKDMMVVVCV